MKSTPATHNASDISLIASKILNALIQATTERALGTETIPDSLGLARNDTDSHTARYEFEIYSLETPENSYPKFSASFTESII